MSDTPACNDRYRCGSGKKDKRCCSATDEAAARERPRQQALFQHELFGDRQFDADDEGGEFFHIEDDVARPRRAHYYRRVLHPPIRQAAVGSAVGPRHAGDRVGGAEDSAVGARQQRESVNALEGEWGEPKAGNPIQVDVIDVIDLETDMDVVSILVFNRAISLAHVDSEEMRRIHRWCGVLEAAALSGPEWGHSTLAR